MVRVMVRVDMVNPNPDLATIYSSVMSGQATYDMPKSVRLRITANPEHIYAKNNKKNYAR